MAICPCCCTNRPTDGKFCICDDYTQMVIEIPGLGGVPEGCGCAATTLVADLDSPVIQEFASENCRGPGFPNYAAKYTVQAGGCGFLDCVHFAPGFLGNFLYTLDSTIGPPAAAQVLFFDFARGQPGGLSVSDFNESCGDFSARLDRRVYSQRTVNSLNCEDAIGGSWSLQ